MWLTKCQQSSPTELVKIVISTDDCNIINSTQTQIKNLRKPDCKYVVIGLGNGEVAMSEGDNPLDKLMIT